MARPTKQGIDYFPLDTNFDDKTQLFIAVNGAAGLGILITVWQLIYQNEGYFTPYSDDLFLLVRMKLQIEVSAVKECIDAAIERGIFCKSLFSQHKILTSKAIQKRFFIAARKKKEVMAIKKYICGGVSGVENDNIIWVNVAGNATKEEEKEKEDITASPDADEFQNDVNAKPETEYYRSKKERKLKGDVLKNFNLFWDAFDFRRGKADAADEFLNVYSPELFPLILQGARSESIARKDVVPGGKSPKWAQGWLSGRRWEDEGPAEGKGSDCSCCDYKIRGDCPGGRSECKSFIKVVN